MTAHPDNAAHDTPADAEIDTLFTVAVYPPGDSYNRLLVPPITCETEQEARTAAIDYATRTLRALAPIAPAQWRTSVVAIGQVQDATHPSTTTHPDQP